MTVSPAGFSFPGGALWKSGIASSWTATLETGVATRLFQFAPLEIGDSVDAEQSIGRIIRIAGRKVLTGMLAN